jgi:hypothetical protein
MQRHRHSWLYGGIGTIRDEHKKKDPTGMDPDMQL